MESKKRNWGKPEVGVQLFMPNEYCAPCGDGTTMVTYTFWCDAGSGSYYVWLDNNILGGPAEGDWVEVGSGWYTEYEWQGNDEYIGRFHPCQATHSVTVPKGTSIDDVFPYGLISKQQSGYNTTRVRIWRGDDGNNIHCTTHLDESEYTTHNPS